MDLLVRYGRALGAERLVETNNVVASVSATTPFMRDFARQNGGMDAVFSQFSLDSDEVVKTMAGWIRGAEVTEIQFQSDGACAVTMQINLGDVLRTITRTVKGKTTVENSLNQYLVSETGMGAPPPLGQVAQGATVVVDEVRVEETLRRVLAEKPVSK